jgi:hypothetical protein
MTVLFLLAEFPPVNTTGAYRSFKFVNKLIDLGIQPIVLTIEETDSSNYFKAIIDKTILKKLDSRVIIYKIKTENRKINQQKSRLNSFFDIFFSLQDPLSKLIRKQVFAILPSIFEKHKPEKVYVSLPPFSMWEIGISISEMYKIPLITDMRDLWAFWGSDPHQTYFHFLLKRRMEHKLFKSSVKIIGVTPQLISIFIKAHPKIQSNKFVTIFNGFDAKMEIDSIPKYSKTKIKIGYTGAFYFNEESQQISDTKWFNRNGIKKFYYYPKKEDWLYRSPYFFLKALYNLFLQKPYLRNNIEFHFIGKEPLWLIKMIADFQLEANYFSYGFISKDEVSVIQSTFDAFLCTSEKVINEDHYCLPSKIFDYINFGKPILGFVTEGIQKEFILKSNIGIVTNPDNIQESMNAIEGLFQFKGLSLDKEYIKKFSSSHLSFQLAEVIKQL